MCTTCGCSSNDHSHSHSHSHSHVHDHAETRRIEVEQNILSKNNRFAEQNRHALAELNILAFNFVSSPGSGKTAILTRTIDSLQPKHTVAVIEGDQQTENDAERIRATGAPAIQINTGKGCHLDAHAVGHALEQLPLDRAQFVFIENVGNLVCPAAFDLGEQAKVVVLSVTEGDDKPLKYPDMFKASQVMLINKVDLLPYVDFDLDKSIDYARRINPDIQVLRLSATTGEGFGQWIEYLTHMHQTDR